MRSPRLRPPLVLTLGLVLPLLVAGCSPGAAGASRGASISVPAVTDAWVRPPIGPDRPAAGYLTITAAGGDGDALVGVASPVAASVEIHESMTDSGGMMGMQPVKRIDIEPGGTVRLEPGGYHLMLLSVSDMPAVGATVELTLTFEKAGDVVVQAEVRAN